MLGLVREVELEEGGDFDGWFMLGYPFSCAWYMKLCTDRFCVVFFV